MNYGVCDVCGQPATNCARDVMRYDGGQSWWNFKSLGSIKRGCDAHVAESVTYDEAMQVVERKRYELT